MQGDQTGSVAGQQPAQQQDTRQPHSEEQAGGVPATLYDIDLRNIRLGDGMPALSDNAQDYFVNNNLTIVLRQPVGCTIEALVVDPLACCKRDFDVRYLRGQPWWPLAEQMRSLVKAGTFTLGHWAELSEDNGNTWANIRSLLEQRHETAQAAARRDGVTNMLTLQQRYEASERAREAATRAHKVLDSVWDYLTILRLQVAEAQGRVEGALQAADAMRTQATATAATVQPRKQIVRDEYGQECLPLLSAAVGQALYDSVYNATWGALEYTANGVIATGPLTAENVVLPVVPCGTLPDTLVMDDNSVAAAQNASTAPDALTLYSPLGWPTNFISSKLERLSELINDNKQRVATASAAQQLELGSVDYKNTLFVRGEVQRAWQSVVCARNILQCLRQGSATTQGTATAAAAAPARAQGEHGDDAVEATTQAQAQAPNDDHNAASEVHVPAQDGERVDAAKALAQTQVLVTDEQQTSTATSAANVQAQGEPHDDAAEAQGQAHEHSKQHSDSTKAQGQLQAGGEQGDNAEAAPAQVQGKAQTQGKRVVVDTTKRPHVIVSGTPGIGKSMAVGGYVLYKLLHEEGERALPYVLFEVNDLSFVFDKRNKTVACYDRDSFKASYFVSAVKWLCARIFDCSECIAYNERHYNHIGEINIVLTSPNVKNTQSFIKRKDNDNVICSYTVHAWTLREMLLVGRYVGMTPDTVVERVRHVGPLPRYVLEIQGQYERRLKSVTKYATDKSTIEKLPIPLCSVNDVIFDDPKNPTNVLYDMRRETDAFDDVDRIAARLQRDAREPQTIPGDYHFVPLSPYIYKNLFETMTNKAKQNKDYLASVLATCAAHPGALEHFVLQSLTYKSFWQLCAHTVDKERTYCTYMPRSSVGAAADEPDTPLRTDAMSEWLNDFKQHDVEYFDKEKGSVNFDVKDKLRVFVPRSRAFPLVDAFVLLYYANRVHFIGVQVTIAEWHRKKTDVLRSFYNNMPTINLKNKPVNAAADTSNARNARVYTGTASTENKRLVKSQGNIWQRIDGTRCMIYAVSEESNMHAYQTLENVDMDNPGDNQCYVDDWTMFSQYRVRVKPDKVLQSHMEMVPLS